MRTGQAFLIVYDITSMSSFEDAMPMYDLICRIKDTDTVPVVCFYSIIYLQWLEYM
jgi:hypothetical protein